MASARNQLMPMTADQVVRIKRLKKEIANLAKQVNKPYAMALAAIGLPALIYIVLLSPLSPFHKLYFQLFDEAVQKDLDRFYKGIERNVQGIMGDYQTILTEMENLLQKAKDDGHNLSREGVIDLVKQFRPTFHDGMKKM